MTLIQPQTDQTLKQALNNTAHAFLFSGPAGAGKAHIAHYFAGQKLGLSLDALQKHPYFRSMQPIGGVHTIDQIRELQKFLRLKTLGSGNIRRAAILEDAHLMTQEAQNALLKSLEEPPADTIIILTTPSTRELKDTIYSRAQTISVLPVALSQAREYFADTHPSADIQKAHLMSGGYGGLLHALLHNKDHPLSTQIQTVKSWLASDTFTRLTKVDELSKQKENLPLFLQACKLIASTALQQAADKGSQNTAKRWHHTLSLVHDAQASLPHHPNPKLLLTHLAINM